MSGMDRSTRNSGGISGKVAIRRRRPPHLREHDALRSQAALTEQPLASRAARWIDQLVESPRCDRRLGPPPDTLRR
jgi:hypothetical protein